MLNFCPTVYDVIRLRTYKTMVLCLKLRCCEIHWACIFFEARTKTLVSFVVTSFVTVYHIAMSMAVLNTLKFLSLQELK